jgi:hypothetical protein
VKLAIPRFRLSNSMSDQVHAMKECDLMQD